MSETSDIFNVIIDKSQGIAIHLRGGKIVSSHIFSNLLFSLPVKTHFKSLNIRQNCKQEGGLHIDDH